MGNSCSSVWVLPVLALHYHVSNYPKTWRHEITVMLTDSVGQEFGKGTVGMVCFCSTMLELQPRDSEADSAPGDWKYLKVSLLLCPTVDVGCDLHWGCCQNIYMWSLLVIWGFSQPGDWAPTVSFTKGRAR